MNKKQLQERWTHDQTESANRVLIGKGESRDIYNQVDGKVDFRGLSIKGFIKNVELNNIDFSFSYTEWAGQFGMAKVKSCIFNNVDYRSNVGDFFEDCSFNKSKMNKVVLRGKFSNCVFHGANLSSAQGVQIKFVDCSFEKVNFSKAHLLNCHFERCVFRECKFGNGSLAGSVFKDTDIDIDAVGNTLIDNIQIQ